MLDSWLMYSADQDKTAKVQGEEEAGPGGRLRLVALVDGQQVARVELGEAPVLVGRSMGCEVVVPHSSVSGRHLKVRPMGGRALVRDLETTNGTWLQGLKVGELVVPAGTVLRLGLAELRVEDASVPEPLAWGPFASVSPRMQQCLQALQHAAVTDLPVLLEGEPGTGRATAAQALHAAGRRAQGALIKVDCRTLPASEAGAVLFGRVALEARPAQAGAFEQAQGGTLFLQEVEHLPAQLQPLLAQAVGSQRIKPLGAEAYRRVDVRVLVSKGVSEEAGDMWRQLSFVRIHLPPLRERVEDLPLLVRAFLGAMGERAAGFVVSPDLLRALAEQPWAENVRELRRVLERTVAQASNPTPAQPGPGPLGPRQIEDYHKARAQALEAFERQFVAELLEVYGRNISRAAREVGLNRVYLHRLIRKHGLGE